MRNINQYQLTAMTKYLDRYALTMPHRIVLLMHINNLELEETITKVKSFSLPISRYDNNGTINNLSEITLKQSIEFVMEMPDHIKYYDSTTEIYEDEVSTVIKYTVPKVTSDYYSEIEDSMEQFRHISNVKINYLFYSIEFQMNNFEFVISPNELLDDVYLEEVKDKIENRQVEIHDLINEFQIISCKKIFPFGQRNLNYTCTQNRFKI